MLKGYVLGSILIVLSLILLVFGIYYRTSLVEKTYGEKLRIERFYDRVIDTRRVIMDVCKDPDYTNPEWEKIANTLSDTNINVKIKQEVGKIHYEVSGFGLKHNGSISC